VVKPLFNSKAVPERNIISQYLGIKKIVFLLPNRFCGYYKFQSFSNKTPYKERHQGGLGLAVEKRRAESR
jgi:hypothetical protein